MPNHRELINEERIEYESREIEIVPGFFFNQKETIERIYRYYNSKFENGDVDRDGDKKYFFNVVRSPCKVTTKGIDFEAKDIKVLTAAGGNTLHTWFFERDLKFWMKDIEFGKVLNRIFEELPIFGSVVLKLVNGKPEFVDLRNFIIEQSADNLGNSNYIIERHLYSPIEFKKIGEEMGWDNIQDTLDEHAETKTPYIAVYERYGHIVDFDETGNETRIYKKLILADVGRDETDRVYQNRASHPGFVLEEKEIDKHPYYEFHLEKIAGRWLGMGVVEILFDAQVNQNETVNLESKAGYWNALRVFQSADPNVNKNLKSDIRDGEVLNPDSPVTQVEMPDRNLAYFGQRTQKWASNVDELTFRFEVVTGQRAPAGTTLGAIRISSAQTGAYFAQLRENIAMDVKKFLYEAVLPRFEEEQTSEHILRLVGEDLDKLNEIIIQQQAQNELIQFLVDNDELPTVEHFEFLKAAIGEQVKQGTERLIKIPDGFYKNLKYKLDIVITGQYRDTETKAAALFAALQAVTVDPTLLTDPVKKKFFYQWLEEIGINPTDFEVFQPSSFSSLLQDQGRVEAPAQKGGGGGVSAPAPQQEPVEQTTTQQI